MVSWRFTAFSRRSQQSPQSHGTMLIGVEPWEFSIHLIRWNYYDFIVVFPGLKVTVERENGIKRNSKAIK
jgi:hypothetical protein